MISDYLVPAVNVNQSVNCSAVKQIVLWLISVIVMFLMSLPVVRPKQQQLVDVFRIQCSA